MIKMKLIILLIKRKFIKIFKLNYISLNSFIFPFFFLFLFKKVEIKKNNRKINIKIN